MDKFTNTNTNHYSTFEKVLDAVNLLQDSKILTVDRDTKSLDINFFGK